MSDSIEGIKFTIQDVQDHLGIPYGYARTLMYRIFNWPQDIELHNIEIVIGKDSDFYQKMLGQSFIKGTININEDLTKVQILDYIKEAAKSVINLSPWIKE